MQAIVLPFDQIRQFYPDEWVLLGNPKMQDTQILDGIVAYHSKDKKEVCYRGRDFAAAYDTVTIVYTGDVSKNRKIGILRRL